MKRGYLSDYFDGVAAKRLSAVEVDAFISHQHEINGVEGLRKLLGEPEESVQFPARLVYLSDTSDEPIVEDSTLTWYDARQRARKEHGVMRKEYRLYFKTTEVYENASAGDLLVIAKSIDDSLLVVIAENSSSISNQIEWLFGFDDLNGTGFSTKSNFDNESDRIGFATRFILESMGVEVDVTEDNYLDKMLDNFNGTFPSTYDFSTFARSTLEEVDARDDPDLALMLWIEREELLFRTLERHLIADRLSKGFSQGSDGDVDVDGFIRFSLSVQNRRKSRAGLALENHLETLFIMNGVRYKRHATTENKATPDFLFPGKLEYEDPNFDTLKLTMLGVKYSCKERWRQVLAEADRIEKKNLLTLEPSISTDQTDEMRSKNLQLVVPRKLQETYALKQQNWLIDVRTFTTFVKSLQTV